MQVGLLVILTSSFKNMAEEKGRHLSFFKIKQNTLLTFLLPSVFAAVWYFPRLSVYFFWQKPAAPDPCTITPVSSSRQSYHCYYFLTSRLLCSLYKRGQLSKQQRDNRDCSFTFLLSEATKGQTRDGGRERIDVCRQKSCTPEMATSSRSAFCPRVAYWPACRPTLGTTSGCAGLPVPKGGAGIQLQLKKALLALSDGHRKREAHILLFALAWRSCITSPKINSSWSHPCCRAGGIQPLRRCRGVCLIS